MNVKKFLASMLVFAMLLSVMSFTVFASETTIEVATTEALQAALDAATDGTTIQLQSNVAYGTVKIQPVEGNGNTKTGLDYHSTHKYEYVREVNNLTIKGADGATLDGIEIVTGTQLNSVWYYADINGIVIDSVTFTSNTPDSVHTNDSPLLISLESARVDGLTVNNCKMDGNNGGQNFVYIYGSQASGSTFETYSKNITITKNTVTNVERLCELRETENLTISENTITNTAQQAILLANSGNGNYSGNITIADNTADNIANRFVRIAGVDEAATVTISENEITGYNGADSDFIKVSDCASEETVSIANNTLEGEATTFKYANGTYQAVVEETPAVAMIGETPYTTLQAALDAADANAEIVLCSDVADVDATISKNITLNLGGKTVTDAYIIITGDVTIKNGFIKNTNEPYPLVVQNGGKLTVENVAIEASKSDRAIWVRSGSKLVFNSGSILATKGENNTKTNLIAAIYTDSNTDVTINGGTITVDTPNNKAIGIFGNYTNANVTVNDGKISTSGKNYSYGINVDGDITVNGGEIVTNEKGYGYSSGIRYGNNYALVTATGDVTITGGTITTNGYSGYIASVGRTYSSNAQTVTITGGTLKNDLSEVEKTTGGHKAPVLVWEGSASPVTATITDGDFSGFSADLLREDNEATTLTVSGGTFDVNVNKEFLADGFEMKDNGDGTYGVVDIWTTDYATNGNTIRFLFDANIDGEVISGIKFIKVLGTDANYEEAAGLGGETTTSKTFYGDVTDVPEGATFYAVAFVKLGDTTYWSVPVMGKLAQ